MFSVAARVSRVGESVSLWRTPSTFGSDTRSRAQAKCVLARRQNQHAKRVRYPAAAETTRPGSCKFLFEIVKAAKCGFDVIGKFAFRFAARVRPHDLPEERMVGMATAVISHHRANIFRNSA